MAFKSLTGYQEKETRSMPCLSQWRALRNTDHSLHLSPSFLSVPKMPCSLNSALPNKPRIDWFTMAVAWSVCYNVVRIRLLLREHMLVLRICFQYSRRHPHIIEAFFWRFLAEGIKRIA